MSPSAQAEINPTRWSHDGEQDASRQNGNQEHCICHFTHSQSSAPAHMGKRQLHGGVHYQCDWSGFAIPK
eukprot:4087461-Pleurochrysis_carterae.AAC.1